MSLAQRLWRRRPGALPVAALSLVLAFTAGTAWLMRQPAPLAGQPVVVAAIPEQAEIITSSTTPAEDGAPTEDVADDTADGMIDPNAIEISGGEEMDGSGAVQDLAPEDAMAPEKHEEAMIIVAPHRAMRAAPIVEVTEKSADGPLPRIGDGGQKPFDTYSQVTPMAIVQSGRPKITLVLGGMGLNERLTKKALDLLPGDVTLGFAPYGDNLQAQVNQARGDGHEILLQVPMEPVGYPATNPGPRTLLSDATPEQNLSALKWLMSRFAGYSGITNYMGGRLLTSEEALRPVLAELKSRGLAYLEDASVKKTRTSRLARELRLPVQHATMVIDADPSAAAISAALAQLEKEARKHGSAIATGSGLDITIETVAEWAKTLQEKGILLVPVSAAYKGRAT
ncbi:divergent polysaccharide deacetylase family protein [Aestuariivirga litoralis]|nr:divergent polysaccharide deacetylase family protein [Aestuariivirga litoralis]